MTKYSLISILLVLFWSSCGQADSNNIVENDAIANERPPLTGDVLAKYWGLNCQQIATATQGWAEKELLLQRPDMTAVNWRGLELCAVIYSVRDTGRYEPCPDYGGALLALKSMRSGQTKYDPMATGDYLTGCGLQK
tara:strand:- start:10101 stop:10511 length:411 start_codon:yes stop_codon:yes gene_type:complete